ncbi:MAG: PD-(D/E)XK nuclease superfamily protein [Bacteroidota bacterium]|jgi:hypothetical protein
MPDTSSGQVFENKVLNALKSQGFCLSGEHERFASNKIIITNKPYTTIYGHQGKTEFYLQEGNREIRIECKYQDVAGSKIEALPYLYLNSVESFPEKEIILLFGGNFFEANKPDNYIKRRQSQWGCTDWLRKACDSRLYLPDNSEKVIKFMFYSEFNKWILDGMPKLVN